MCGIIGYTGTANAIPKMLKGLSVLEYRGYDSVGIAAETEDGTKVVKCKGRVRALEELLNEGTLEESNCAIGHTRWATHGGPSDTNAHPHRQGKVTLVHNGIIENYAELKADLQKSGVVFLSETDTEVASALINAVYTVEKDPVKTIFTACKKLKGAYAFGILFEDHPGEVFVTRCGSPLILARGKDGMYLASDMTAILPFTNEYAALPEGVVGKLEKESVTLWNTETEQRTAEWKITTMTPESAQKGGYRHFMLKEIHEEAEAVKKSLSPRIGKDGTPDFSADGLDDRFFKDVKNVQIVACGSAMHAGLLGAKLIESMAKIPAAVYIASEYRYYPPYVDKGTLVLLISQSGETADTLAALRYAKANGVATLAIVNAVETSIAREADRRIYTYAGPEIAVATTKGYCTQLSVLYFLAAAMAKSRNLLSDAEAKQIVKDLYEEVPAVIDSVIENQEQFRSIAKILVGHEHVFYIGRGLDYYMSMEAALKLKEISYIHCEAYAAGELKHGTISLVEPGTPVLAIAGDPQIFEKTESNIREVKSRGAHVILITRAELADKCSDAEETVVLPVKSDAAALFGSLLSVQLIAYETAVALECDVDRPRNLAKSVTVE